MEEKKHKWKKYWSLLILLYYYTASPDFSFYLFQLDRTPLHWAAANGNLDIIEKLVETGADVEAKDKVRKHVKQHDVFDKEKRP